MALWNGLCEKQCVGNTHIRFDEVEVARSADQRRRAQLCERLPTLALAVIVASVTQAATYYVAPGGAAGASDAVGYGGLDRPFATLAYAYQQVMGDTAPNNEIVLLRGTHSVTNRISKGMHSLGVIRGETGNPADVTLNFGERADSCLLVADIQLRDVTVTGSNPDTESKGGALRVQSSAQSYAEFPAQVSNCVIVASKACAVILSGPGQVLDCRFEGNALGTDANKCHSLVYCSSDGSSKGVRIIKGCTFTSNSSSTNGTCISAMCSHDVVRIEDCSFVGNSTSANAADVFVGSKVELKGSRFIRSSAGLNGGAVFANNGGLSLLVDSCTFSNCTATLSGAAIATEQNSKLAFEIVDTTFSTNVSVKTGGALYLHSATGSVTRCVAEANSSTEQAGGFARVAAASRLAVSNSVFRGNYTKGQGGVFFADVAVPADGVTSYSTLELVDSSFESNVARCIGTPGDNLGWCGGGVLALGNSSNSKSVYAALFVDRCVFMGNATPGSGGAIYMRNASITPDACRSDIRNSLFVGNSAGYNGGAINLVAYKTYVDNCTFVTNAAGESGPNFYHRWPSYIRNCIIVGDQGDANGTFCGQDGNTSLYQNSIQVGRTDAKMTACFTGDACTNLTMGEIGMVRFADYANGDYSLAGGLAKNSGQNLDWMSDSADCLDLAGRPRVYRSIAEGGNVDIGCYEVIGKDGLIVIIR